MRRLVLISTDVFLVAGATIIAVMLRGDFLTTIEDKFITLIPYMSISLGAASVVFLLGGLDRTPWRHSSVGDHLQIIVLTGLVILLSLVLTFVVNRLDGVARSLPILQGALIVTMLIAARSVARFWYARKIHNNGNGRVDTQAHETILVVGINALTELFLLSVREFATRRVEVAGILAEESNMRGRTIQHKPVLGTVEELQDVLQSLEVHGVTVDRIVVALAVDRLRPRALETLSEAEKSSNIVIQFLSEQLGFEDVFQSGATLSGRQRNIALGQRSDAIDIDHANFTGQSLWLGKRIVDVFGAAFLMIMLSPIAVLVAFIVALDVGFPLIFWQQRPGLHGQPFKLYKFRTMRASHDKHQKRIPDDQRSSAIGQIIRRARLDELPQLYNVLVGDMSLVGPRPLLPCDQSGDYAARLSVRPGITGWAQVNGGRIISADDKCILDIWYAQNVSLVLDLKIALSTVKMVFLGDRINAEAINQARSAPGLQPLLRTVMVPAE